MKHQELKELLPLYVDGGLDKDEEEWVESHLAECEECRKELESYQEHYDFLTQIDDVEVSADFLASVMRRVREEQRLKTVQRENEWQGCADEEHGLEEDMVREVRIENNGGREARKERVRWWDRLTELMKLRVRIPAGVMGAVAVVALLLILIRPMGLLPYGNRGDGSEMQKYGVQQELQREDKNIEAPTPVAPKQGRLKMGTMTSRSESEVPQAAQDQLIQPQNIGIPTPISESGAAPVPVGVERKVIKTATLRVAVKDLDGAQKKVMEMVKDLKGFVANSNNWVAGNNQRFSSYQLRIPANEFYAALEKYEGLGEVKHRSLGGQDVTEEYIDIQSRLKNLKLQEERYRDLLQRANRVEDILSIERELERVRSSIESMQGRINFYDNQTSMSTIDLELAEPEPIASADWGLVNALRQAFRAMVDTFLAIVVRCGQVLPYLVLIFLAYGVYRVVRRKK